MGAVIVLSEVVPVDRVTKGAEKVNVGAVPPLIVHEKFPRRHLCDK